MFGHPPGEVGGKGSERVGRIGWVDRSAFVVGVLRPEHDVEKGRGHLVVLLVCGVRVDGDARGAHVGDERALAGGSGLDVAARAA